MDFSNSMPVQRNRQFQLQPTHHVDAVAAAPNGFGLASSSIAPINRPIEDRQVNQAEPIMYLSDSDQDVLLDILQSKHKERLGECLKVRDPKWLQSIIPVSHKSFSAFSLLILLSRTGELIDQMVNDIYDLHDQNPYRTLVFIKEQLAQSFPQLPVHSRHTLPTKFQKLAFFKSTAYRNIERIMKSMHKLSENIELYTGLLLIEENNSIIGRGNLIKNARDLKLLNAVLNLMFDLSQKDPNLKNIFAGYIKHPDIIGLVNQIVEMRENSSIIDPVVSKSVIHSFQKLGIYTPFNNAYMPAVYTDQLKPVDLSASIDERDENPYFLIGQKRPYAAVNETIDAQPSAKMPYVSYQATDNNTNDIFEDDSLSASNDLLSDNRPFDGQQQSVFNVAIDSDIQKGFHDQAEDDQVVNEDDSLNASNDFLS